MAIVTNPNKSSVKVLAFLIAVAVWRKLSKRPSVQAPLHSKLKRCAVLLQWYTVLFVGVALTAVWCLASLIKNCWIVHWDEAAVEANFEEHFSEIRANTTLFDEIQEEQLRLGPAVTTINILGQAAGSLVIPITVYHCFKLLVIPSQRKAVEHEDYQNYSWHVPKRINWLLWIAALPAVFYIEVTLSNISVWNILNGLSPYDDDHSFEKALRLEMLYVKEEIQVATLFQFTAVYSFTRLIGSILTDTSLMKHSGDEEVRNAAREYKRLIRNGGFIGIWVYVVAGIIRAAIVIGLCTYAHYVVEVANETMDERVEYIEGLDEAFTALVGTTFTLLTILSVINMLVMTRTTLISVKLGDKSKGEYDANQKFIGVRLLLICSEVIPKVCDMFTQGTPEQSQMEKVTKVVSFLYMSPPQAEILKNSILSFACLLAAIMNFIFWKNLDIEQAGLLDFTDISRQGAYTNMSPTDADRTKDADQESTVSLLS